MKRRFLLSLLVMVAMLIMVPLTATAAGSDYEAGITATKNSAVQYNGTDTLKVDFMLKSGTSTITAIQNAVIAVDLTKFDVLICDSQTSVASNATATAFNQEKVSNPDSSGAYTYTVYQNSQTGEAFKGDVVFYKDGNLGLISLNPDWTGSSAISFSESTSMMSVLLGLKEGVSWDVIPKDSIRFATRAEAKAMASSSVLGINNDLENYFYLMVNGSSDTLKVPEFTISGFSFSEGSETTIKPSKEDDTPVVVPSLTKEERSKDTIALQIGNYAAAVDGALSKIDPDNNAVIPYIQNSRTYVPLRFISEKLKAEVTWDDVKREVTVKKDGKTIIVPIGADYYTLDGQSYAQDAPAEIIQSRTFIPVRFVAEALNNSVYWDESNRVVIIAPKAQPWTGTTAVEKELLNDFLLIMSPLVRDFQ